MAYNINEALERLEKNLNDVSSARQQVEETVASSNALQEIITNYVSSLTSIQTEIQRLVSDLEQYKSLKTSDIESGIVRIKKSCETAITSFDNQIQASSDKFNSKVGDIISLFTQENDRLKEQISNFETIKTSLQTSFQETTKNIEALKNDVKKISSGIDLSEKIQKSILAAVKSDTEDTTRSIKSECSGLSEKINEQKNSLEELLNGYSESLKHNVSELNAHIESLSKKSESILSTQADLKSLCNKTKSNVETFQENTAAQLSKINKGILINRWVTVIGFISVIGLLLLKHVVHFLR